MTQISSQNGFDQLSRLEKRNWLGRGFARVSERFFRIPDRFDQYYTHIKNSENVLVQGKRPWLRPINWVLKNWLNFDYADKIRIGKKTTIMQPPAGAFFLMILPFTIIPRAIQAIRRSHDGDRSEFFDILRRDIPTLVVMLYTLGPLKKAWARSMSTKSGVKLFGGKNIYDGELLKSSKTNQAYLMNSAESIRSYLGTNKRAAAGLSGALLDYIEKWEHAAKSNLKGPVKDKVEGLLTQLRKTADDLRKNIVDKKTGNVLQNKIHHKDNIKLSEEMFELIEKLDGQKKVKLRGLQNDSKMYQKIEQAFPSMKEFLTHKANLKRLPISIISFLIVCLGIGWAPVWINDRINEMIHGKDNKSKNKDNSPTSQVFDPNTRASMFQTLNAHSPLASRFNHSPYSYIRPY